MQNNTIIMVALIILPIIFSPTLYALEKKIDANFNELSLSTSLGSLSGESHEYVYAEFSNRKISQLNWKINNAAIIKGELNYDLLFWLSLNGKGWVTLTKNKAPMDDYDWLNPNQSNWTDWSHHENTYLNYANELNLSLQAWFMRQQNYKFGLVAGYQRNNMSWRSTGGCYQYNNHTNTGCFSNDKVGIDYQQRFSTPYVGLAGRYAINNFEFNALFKFSDWVSADDYDEHYARNLTFKEHGNNSPYYSATIDAGYYFTQNIKVFTEVSYNLYSTGIADTEIIVHDSSEHFYLNNAAGLANKSYTLSLGLHNLF